MYLHIGEDLLIKTEEIIAILDKHILSEVPSMKNFFKNMEDSTVNLAKGQVKSIIITKNELFLSPLASTTLLKRSSQRHIQFDESFLT
ncbi:extracellular matrix regulator RemB [Peribacillus tepidiphilus]|jgi:extracellular matrix regulatory protein B|uniref:extracellular matrix regulator RemB n=1 Tax=Peribacillus tepidiphilus TaxID=2652445 RepID=UPI001291286F|nr:extracellular matrix/biofilm biosynthesis regulator RemA family protein [Peribacillus tepidiphilus]